MIESIAPRSRDLKGMIVLLCGVLSWAPSWGGDPNYGPKQFTIESEVKPDRLVPTNLVFYAFSLTTPLQGCTRALHPCTDETFATCSKHVLSDLVTCATI